MHVYMNVWVSVYEAKWTVIIHANQSLENQCAFRMKPSLADNLFANRFIQPRMRTLSLSLSPPFLLYPHKRSFLKAAVVRLGDNPQID